jgi:predicted nucleotidyltransferase
VKIYSRYVKQEPRLPVFRSPEQERILAELFVFADRPVSITDLAARSRTSLGGVHKEVERLEAAGLVRSETVGRSRLVRANVESPVYPDLRGLLVKTAGPARLLSDALAGIEGIEEAFIYGSWADPAVRDPADVDVLVIGRPDVGAVYDAASAVEDRIGRPVNVVVRSVEEWADADGAFERSVRERPKVELA